MAFFETYTIGIRQEHLQKCQDCIVKWSDLFNEKFSRKRPSENIGIIESKISKVFKSTIIGPFPSDLWEHVFIFSSDPLTILALSLVNKELYELAQNYDIWDSLLKGTFTEMHIKEIEPIMESRLRVEKMSSDKPSPKLLFIELWGRKCKICKKFIEKSKLEYVVQDPIFLTPLNGYVCNHCHDEYPSQYRLIPKTQAKHDFNLKDTDLEELIPQVEPVYGKVKKNRLMYLMNDCHELKMNKRLKELQTWYPEFKALSHVRALNGSDPKRLFVEFGKCRESLDKNVVKGFYQCSSCRKRLFVLEDRVIEPQYTFHLKFLVGSYDQSLDKKANFNHGSVDWQRDPTGRKILNSLCCGNTTGFIRKKNGKMFRMIRFDLVDAVEE